MKAVVEMKKMKKFRIVAFVLLSFCAGILAGGYFFSKSQPRSLLALHPCQSCMAPKDMLGLLASAGIQRFSTLMPFKICETDKTIAIKWPFSRDQLHYVIIPKKDIKDIGQISEEDIVYLRDAFSVARGIIEKEKLSKYQFYTNGPALQDVTYLHFHLIVDRGKPQNSTRRAGS